VLRHVRLSVISVKFVIGDFCENLSRKKNVFKGGAKMSGTLYDANRMYAQITAGSEGVSYFCSVYLKLLSLIKIIITEII